MEKQGSRANTGEESTPPQVVLITGTSSGIGQAIALHQARLGNVVYATMRDVSAGESLRESAAKEQLELHVLELDVTDDLSVERAIKTALDRSGHIDVLINNAGVSTIESVEGSLEAARATFEVNYFGMLRTITAVLPSMRARKSGTIMNVSSVTGVAANGGSGAYAASKHAIEAMSEALAIETVSHGIRVIILQPGFIKTPIFPKAHIPYPEPPTGPYARAIRRGLMMYSDPADLAAPPMVVAEVVQAALTDSEPKLRYKAGSAKKFIEGRRQACDEDWVATGLVEDDKEWFATLSSLLKL